MNRCHANSHLSSFPSELHWEHLKYHGIAARKKYVKVYNYKLKVNFLTFFFFSGPHMCVITKGPLIFLIKIQYQKAAYKLPQLL